MGSLPKGSSTVTMKFIIIAICLIAATLGQTQQVKDGVKTKHFGFGYNGYPLFGSGYHYPSHYPSHYPAHSHYPAYYYYNPYQPSLYPAGFPSVLRNTKKN